MKNVKVKYANGDVVYTSINGTREEILEYFKVGKTFNIGSSGHDDIQAIVSCEILDATDVEPQTMLKSKLDAVSDISKNHPMGFTINKTTLDHITKGFAVAISETQGSFGLKGLENVLEESKRGYIDAIGGWFNAADDKYYFDAVMIVEDLEDALHLGFRNKQKAIYNLATGEEIKLFIGE